MAHDVEKLGIMAFLLLGRGVFVQVVEPLRWKQKELYLEGVQQSHRSIRDCQAKDGDHLQAPSNV